MNMSRLPIKRPVTPNKYETEDGQSSHWSRVVYECDVSARVDGSFDFNVEGGSDNGEFPFFGSLLASNNGKIFCKDDILLEIQGQKVVGYTQRDVVAWLNHCSRVGSSVKIKAVKAGYLTKDLRQYLNTRFQKGSSDHDLQNTIRDNLYLRTVPCTTRPLRNGEINGIDYTFLSAEEFIALERSGNLLESGIYEGNHYGTPKPQKDILHSPARRNNSIGTCGSTVLPGAHATSEGKRRRNRSNVEAMAAKATDSSLLSFSPHTRSSTPVSGLSPYSDYKNSTSAVFLDRTQLIANYNDFGLLPENWDQTLLESRVPCLTDGTSPWLDTCLAKGHTKNAENCSDNELPFGWERIDDPHYGTYYIDHVNRKTQYENPVLHARQDDDATSSKFGNRSSSWHHKIEQRSDLSRSSGPHSPSSDSKMSPRASRNSSLTQTTNCSNSHDPIILANTNSESFLNGGNPLTPPSNPLSSSPASTHRFPYLHCIPCLNEKHEPPKHMADSAKAEGILPNGTVASNNLCDPETEQRDHQGPTMAPPCGTVEMAFNPFCQNEDSARRDFSRSSSLPGFNTIHKRPAFFTRNPDELRGVFILTSLVKSSRGFGFTIIGGDDPTAEVFLQIKDVVPYGPAWCDGKLQTGDVLVTVNNVCVLGHTHKDVITLFQSISPGEIMQLEMCRGYPLPFDPNDPNTEIVTTVAVSMANAKTSDCQNVYSTSRSENRHSSKLASAQNAQSAESMTRSAKSMPDLSSKRLDLSHPFQQTSAGFMNVMSDRSEASGNGVASRSSVTPEFLSVEIIKGAAGFGFTIADSSYGQKVKKILDRPRCKRLQEGDVLTKINGLEVQGLPHTEVVQVLKDCPCGDTAKIVIQRGFLPPARNKMKSKIRTSEEINGLFGNITNSKSNISDPLVHSSSFNQTTSMPNGRDHKFSIGYRSKTPTAELYSSRDKESVIVARPKTPLVDARNWLRSSPSDYATGKFGGRSSHATNNEEPKRRTRNEFSFQDRIDFAATSYNFFESSPDRCGNPAWYSDQSRGRDWNSHNFRDSARQPESSGNGIREDAPGSSSGYYFNRTRDIEQTNVLPFENNYRLNGIDHKTLGNASADDGTVTLSELNPSSYNSSYIQEYHRRNANADNYALYNTSSSSPADANNLYKSQFSCYRTPQPSNTSTSTMQSVSLKEVGLVKEHSFMGNSAPTDFTSSLRPKMGLYLEDSTHRKHSTSFEHEHPVPYSVHEVQPVSNDTKRQNSDTSYNQISATEDCVDMTVTLLRQDSGFGFRIIGGTEEGSQVSVGHIVPGGSADLDGRLQTGDEILGVDGRSVLNTSHRHVVQLMGSAAANGKVTLHLRRINTFYDCETGHKSGDGIFPYDITVTRNESEGFGFVIISSMSRAGSTIGRIIESSPAERCGRLHVGDTILAVNGNSILNMHHGDIVSLIKDSGYSVSLTVGHPHDDVSSTASVSQKGEDLSLDQDDYCHNVELHRGTKGFGFSIRGGKEFHNMPLFVLRIAENGPAYQDGRIQVGDQIIEINGICTKNMTHAEAIELIREGGNSVRLLVKRCNLPSCLDHSSLYLHPSPLSSPLLNGHAHPNSLPCANQQSLPNNEIYNWTCEPN